MKKLFILFGVVVLIAMSFSIGNKAINTPKNVNINVVNSSYNSTDNIGWEQYELPEWNKFSNDFQNHNDTNSPNRSAIDPYTIGEGDPGYAQYVIKIVLASGDYINDLMNLYMESENGELDSSSSHLRAESLLSMHINETGLSQGTTDVSVPSFYFPIKDYNKAHGDFPADAFTVSKFDKGVSDLVSSSLHTTSIADSGPFQINLNSLEKSGDISEINGYTNGDRNTPDIWYLPDSLAWIDQSFTENVINLFGDIPDWCAAGLYSNIHNRGSLIQQAYGTPYYSSGTNKFMRNINSEDYPVVSELERDFRDTYDSFKVNFSAFDNTHQRMYALCYALKSGYKMNQKFVDLLKSNVILECWNQVNPDEHVGSILELSTLFKDKYVGNLADDLGISENECLQIYGTSGDYSEHYINYGYVYKISEERSDIYRYRLNDGSLPLVVHAYDGVVLGHIFGSEIMSEQLWNYYATLAGAGYSDFTNPRSYYKQFSGQYTPLSDDIISSNIESNFTKMLSTIGITSTVNPVINNMLISAYSVCNTPYVYGGGWSKTNMALYKRSNSLINSDLKPKFAKQCLNSNSDIAFSMYDDNGNIVPAGKGVKFVYDGVRNFDCGALVSWGLHGIMSDYTCKSSLSFSDSTKTLEGLYCAGTGVGDKFVNEFAEFGDIIWQKGHVYFYLCPASMGESLSASLSNTDQDATVDSNDCAWVLESNAPDQFNGVHIKHMIYDGDRIIWRLSQ